jgi:hypothetical protein
VYSFRVNDASFVAQFELVYGSVSEFTGEFNSYMTPDELSNLLRRYLPMDVDIDANIVPIDEGESIVVVVCLHGLHFPSFELILKVLTGMDLVHSGQSYLRPYEAWLERTEIDASILRGYSDVKPASRLALDGPCIQCAKRLYGCNKADIMSGKCHFSADVSSPVNEFSRCIHTRTASIYDSYYEQEYSVTIDECFQQLFIKDSNANLLSDLSLWKTIGSVWRISAGLKCFEEERCPFGPLFGFDWRYTLPFSINIHSTSRIYKFNVNSGSFTAQFELKYGSISELTRRFNSSTRSEELSNLLRRYLPTSIDTTATILFMEDNTRFVISVSVQGFYFSNFNLNLRLINEVSSSIVVAAPDFERSMRIDLKSTNLLTSRMMLVRGIEHSSRESAIHPLMNPPYRVLNGPCKRCASLLFGCTEKDIFRGRCRLITSDDTSMNNVGRCFANALHESNYMDILLTSSRITKNTLTNCFGYSLESEGLLPDILLWKDASEAWKASAGLKCFEENWCPFGPLSALDVLQNPTYMVRLHSSPKVYQFLIQSVSFEAQLELSYMHGSISEATRTFKETITSEELAELLRWYLPTSIEIEANILLDVDKWFVAFSIKGFYFPGFELHFKLLSEGNTQELPPNFTKDMNIYLDRVSIDQSLISHGTGDSIMSRQQGISSYALDGRCVKCAVDLYGCSAASVMRARCRWSESEELNTFTNCIFSSSGGLLYNTPQIPMYCFNEILNEDFEANLVNNLHVWKLAGNMWKTSSALTCFEEHECPFGPITSITSNLKIRSTPREFNFRINERTFMARFRIFYANNMSPYFTGTFTDKSSSLDILSILNSWIPPVINTEALLQFEDVTNSSMFLSVRFSGMYFPTFQLQVETVPDGADAVDVLQTDPSNIYFENFSPDPSKVRLIND